MVYAILIICLIIGVPVAFSIVAALSYFMAAGEFPYNLRIVATQMFGGMRSYPLLAIPLFILAGDLRDNRVGRFRAGLAMVNIWASVIFAGLSGSAVADTSTNGIVSIRCRFCCQCGVGAPDSSNHPIVSGGAFCIDHHFFFSGDRYRPAAPARLLRRKLPC